MLAESSSGRARTRRSSAQLAALHPRSPKRARRYGHGCYGYKLQFGKVAPDRDRLVAIREGRWPMDVGAVEALRFRRSQAMLAIATMALILRGQSFQVHGVDVEGKVVFRRTLTSMSV